MRGYKVTFFEFLSMTRKEGVGILYIFSLEPPDWF